MRKSGDVIGIIRCRFEWIYESKN